MVSPPTPSGLGPDGEVWWIPALDCATEELEIRQALSDVAGIAELRFQLASHSLLIRADAAALAQAELLLQRLGYPPQRLEGTAASTPRVAPVPWARMLLALLLAAAAEAVNVLVPGSAAQQALVLGLSASAIGLAGLAVYLKGLAALRQGRLNINALMAVAVSGAFLIGHWPEAGMVMALYALAEALEAQAADRARQAIGNLMQLAPELATVELRPGEWARTEVGHVVVGQRLRVEPGERIPLDGVVLSGRSAVNQAPVTGESLPVDKASGDAVFAGTLNTDGALEIRSTCTAATSTLARIIHAVEEAQASRAPIQRFVDRFAARYTPVVFLLALLVALLSPVLLGLTPLEAVYRALVLLVIACPCALVIATPVTLVSGLTAAARRGIVIKGGLHLEQARNLRLLAFDKTGTLTTGRPRLEAFEVIDSRIPAGQLRRWAASLACRSDHPISRAIAAGLDAERLPVEELSASGGRGLSGLVEGRPLWLASHRWIQELGLDTLELSDRIRQQQQRARSVSLLADAQGVLALCGSADPLRPSAARAVERLKHLGLKLVMLSGDNALTAELVGRQAGIERVHSGLLPEQKLELVLALQQEGPTGMVGDGINDAPALAGATVGFAMGAAGSDTAMDTADVVVMDDDPNRLADTILLSRQTWRVLWQNIGLALGIKAAFLLLTLTGSATMWQAVVADMGTSLLVIANGLRLLRQRWA
ncbi:cation-translocating P-type ATPase [Cyanobium sp. LEGE 06113]|uniref:heavy metal translocating P-type ATPase n=1 Tax=Cyanobium sp. LEGE 06113 TaxID=1297573 RepID=UPI001881342B|nr:heavy metal translocating P-type ATPase [Cyanobium sp. LEGE 06113]MBE9153593.1 heavy metal translocating P-type ATPase [Cyanobium sp. LEGE 06113]